MCWEDLSVHAKLDIAQDSLPPQRGKAWLRLTNDQQHHFSSGSLPLRQA